MNVLVANVGTQALELYPHTSLATVNKISPKSSVELEERTDGIHVWVNNILAESKECQENGQTDDFPNGYCELGNGEETQVGKLYVFADGSEYQLPSGVKFDGCAELSVEGKDRDVRLIQRHDAVFSQNSLDLGSCDKVPHKILTSDDQPTISANSPTSRGVIGS